MYTYTCIKYITFHLNRKEGKYTFQYVFGRITPICRNKHMKKTGRNALPSVYRMILMIYRYALRQFVVVIDIHQFGMSGCVLRDHDVRSGVRHV